MAEMERHEGPVLTYRHAIEEIRDELPGVPRPK
jgi:hypothetical protein